MAFWKHGTYSIPITVEGTVNARLSLDTRYRNFRNPIPVDAGKTYEELMVR